MILIWICASMDQAGSQDIAKTGKQLEQVCVLLRRSISPMDVHGWCTFKTCTEKASSGYWNIHMPKMDILSIVPKCRWSRNSDLHTVGKMGKNDSFNGYHRKEIPQYIIALPLQMISSPETFFLLLFAASECCLLMIKIENWITISAPKERMGSNSSRGRKPFLIPESYPWEGRFNATG